MLKTAAVAASVWATLMAASGAALRSAALGHEEDVLEGAIPFGDVQRVDGRRVHVVDSGVGSPVVVIESGWNGV